MAVVYFRNPKTASTAIHDVMIHHAGAGAIPVEGDYLGRFREALGYYQSIVVWGRLTQPIMQEFGEELRSEHTVVTVMRNPFDRYISSWAYCRLMKWCAPETTPAELLGMRDTISWRGWHHVHRQQVEALYSGGKLIPHLVLRFECLQDEFQLVTRKLGLPPVVLPHRNETKHSPWRDYYEKDPELRGAVEEAFSEDLAALPYRFEHDGSAGGLPPETKATPHSLTRLPD